MDTGIGSWAQLVDAFEHIQSPDAFVQAASDIFLVDQPSKRQILCLQLLVEEARTMPVWTEPPPLSRRPASTVESGTPPSTPAASVNLTPAPSTATPGDPIELILNDLRKWKREIQDLATLSSRIQEATWYKELISICQEEWVLISGMAVIAGHRIFQFSRIREFITSTIVLVANVETLRARGTSPESIEKYRDYIKSELDDSSSLLHGSNVALFPAETHRPALACSVLEKIVLNNTPHDSTHLSEIKPDGVNLL
eukprot:s1078_g16.t1